MSAYYVTTPIYYANGLPHIGSTYTTTLADFLVRYYSMLGRDTFFLTGTDEHGDKVQQAAEKLGKSPKEFTDEVSSKFESAWKELGLNPSRFIRTTDDDHKENVQNILQKIYDQGDIYFGEYGGHYCTGCERFLTEKELDDGKCPDHQTTPEWVSEKNYFFKMSKYQDQLLDHIKANPDFIRPDRYKNEVLGLLREPLEDLCISRPTSRLSWGIPLPFDENYVTYVWFDALVNYLTGIGYPDQEKAKERWENSEHLIGKDIVKPHGVFWPTMLLAAGIPLYKNLTVHGYWNTPSGKMSKSLGNAVDPLEVKRHVGMDVFRYFVMREMTFGLDGNYSGEALETRYNADLANNLGNLVSRSLSMVHKYRDGEVPIAKSLNGESQELKTNALNCFEEMGQFVEKREFHKAAGRIWELIDLVNVYIDRSKPWSLAKNEENADQLDETLYCQLECIRIAAGCLLPFMPDTAPKILSFLGIDSKIKPDFFEKFEFLKEGSKVEKGEALFPRLEVSKEEKTEKKIAAKPKGEKVTEEKAGLIGFGDFQKIELTVGQIMEASKIEDADKLLKLKVDIGSEDQRQVVAGIAKHYQAEELVGRKVAVVSNLKPAKLRGELSEGMLLAASDDAGNLELVYPGDLIKVGGKIS